MRAENYTYKDIVNFYFPEFTGEECHDVLWCATAYPFCGVRHLCEQLHRKSRQVKDVPQENKCYACIAIACKELDDAMEKVKENETNNH